MPSTPQTITVVNVFDYVIDTAGNPVRNSRVTSTLNFAGATDTSPTVNVGPLQQSTLTDQNGFWQFNLVPNTSLTPTGTFYTITTQYNTYDISVPATGPQQSSAILVNTPSVLSPATVNLTGPITVTGNETVTGNLTVQGTTILQQATVTALSATSNSSIAGDLTIQAPGRLIMTAATSKVLAGATQLSIRDPADSIDLMTVSNTAGNVVTRGSLTVNGLTTLVGSVTTLANIALTATGDSRFLTIQNDSTGQFTAANLQFNNTQTNQTTGTDASARVFWEKSSPGAVTGGSTFQIRIANNNFSNALTPILIDGSKNLILNAAFTAGGMTYGNVGIATTSPATTLHVNGPVGIAPSVGGALPPTSYGSTMVKIAETVLTSSAGSVLFSNIPSGFRHLLAIVSAQDTSTNTAGSFGHLRIGIGGGAIDASTVYNWSDFNVTSNPVGSAAFGSNADNAWGPFITTGGNTGPQWFSRSQIWLPFYASTTQSKTVCSDTIQINAANAIRRMMAGYKDVSFSAAITSIEFTPTVASLASGSSFTLYGVP